MILKQGLHEVTEFDPEAGARELSARGNRVFLLPSGSTDRRSFFDGVRQVLPLDPPVVSHHSWDALSDSLWSGLHDVDDCNIATILAGVAEDGQGAPTRLRGGKEHLVRSDGGPG